MSERLRIALEEASQRAVYLPVQVAVSQWGGTIHPDMVVALPPILWQTLVEAIEAEVEVKT